MLLYYLCYSFPTYLSMYLMKLKKSKQFATNNFLYNHISLSVVAITHYNEQNTISLTQRDIIKEITCRLFS